MAHNKTGLPGFENDTVEKQEEELERMFFNVFMTEEGKIVLTALLEDMCFFRECKSQDEVCLNNFAKFILKKRMGITNTMDITTKLLSCKKE